MRRARTHQGRASARARCCGAYRCGEESGEDAARCRVTHDEHEARREAKRARRDAAKHYIYTLTGPEGVYVGCTDAPERRCFQHYSRACAPPHWVDLLVHEKMRESGPGRWTFRVISVVAGYELGREAERELIEQFRAAG